MEPAPLKTFICYAHEDRSTVHAIRGHLKIFEKKNILEIWDDGEILAGQDWDKSIKLKLETAQLILLFISVDFINSEYIEKTELQASLQRHRDGAAKLIPIIVRRCFWEEYFELGKFQALPPKAKPILSYDLHAIDEAYHAVALGIKAAADVMQQKIANVAQALQAEIERERREKAEAEKQKQKKERLQKQDEITWKTALAAIEKAKTIREKMDALEVYLDELDYQLYRLEGETQLNQLQAAETARKIAEKQQEQQRVETKTPKAPTPIFHIVTPTKEYFIPTAKIIYCKAENNFTEIYVEGEDRFILASETLGKLALRLPATDFFRIHRSYCINRHHLKGTNRSDGNGIRAIMSNQEELSIAHSKKAEFYLWLGLTHD